jgi:hypothetical protein
MEQALAGEQEAAATRCGVIRTTAVDRRTFLLMCRLRYTIVTPAQRDLLAEEVQCFGFTGSPDTEPSWLDTPVALHLLRTAAPEANVQPAVRTEVATELLNHWGSIRTAMDPLVIKRAETLEAAHRRVRASIRLARRGMSVVRHYPPDLLGFLILLPRPKGVQA